MLAPLRTFEARLLPRGWRDLATQILLFLGGYALYELVRGLFGNSGYKPFGDAMKIIDFERALHIFIEPSIQAWAMNEHWLMDAADWIYLNGHFVLTLAVLIFLYVRRNASFYFVRNMFLIAMGLALIGYAVFPTAPPRLLPEWGFTDTIAQFTGVTIEHGASSAFLNAYAAVPSMHVCFAIMTAWPMVRLVRRRPLRILWGLYPLLVTFAVVATGNHYLIDVLLGALTALTSAVLADRLLGRVRPDAWRLQPAAT